MEYPITADAWQRKVGETASNLADPMGIPPLIAEWRTGALIICDGSSSGAHGRAPGSGISNFAPLVVAALTTTDSRGASTMARHAKSA